MAASAPKSRRKRAKARSRARRGLGLAGASVFATTGILGAYVGYPGLRRAQALTACSPVTNEATLDAALGEAENGTCDYISIPAGTILLTANLTNRTIPSSLTIVGAGAGSTIIDGQNSHEGFDLTGADVSISSLTITRTYEDGSQGDAIRMRSANKITLNSVTISSNVSDRSAVYSAGDIEVSYSTFSDNEANDSVGGALYASGAVTVVDSDFDGNYANLDGGAIYASSATVSGGSAFTNNSSDGSGGAIHVDGNIYVYGSTFYTNVANNSGGAIKSSSGDVGIYESTTFTSNQGRRGGAIYAYYDLVVDQSTFTSNSSSQEGGALYAYAGSATVTDSTFAANRSGEEGGAIAIEDYSGTTSSTITGSTFSGNTANFGGLGPYGGGAISTRGALRITNSTLTGNSGYDGGALKADNDDVQFNFCTIVRNTSTNVGGQGIYSYGGGDLSVTNSIVYHNVDGASAAIDIESSGALTLTNSLLTSATSFSAVGASTTSDLLYGDPLLGSLANNGGPTQTMLPAADSPVIGMANPSGAPSTDQRGFSRTTGGLADMGSVERGGTAPEPDLSQMPPAWFQAQQRKEQSAVCPPGMVPSWAEWPNEGTGGWTCEWATWWDVNKGTAGGWVTTPGFNPGLRVSD